MVSSVNHQQTTINDSCNHHIQNLLYFESQEKCEVGKAIKQIEEEEIVVFTTV
jgi:hypothetical protein